MYSVSEVAQIIGVSRQSIYKKIYKEGLQEHLVDGDKGKVVTEQGLEVLKKSFSEYLDSKPDNDNLHEDNSKATDNLQDNLRSVDSITMEYINSLKAEIEHLKNIVAGHAQQNSDLTRLLENSQILLKHEQEKNQLLLESPEAKKKSFWNRFKKQ